MWRGREFQAVGAATAKLREPKRVWTRGTANKLQFDERSLYEMEGIVVIMMLSCSVFCVYSTYVTQSHAGHLCISRALIRSSWRAIAGWRTHTTCRGPNLYLAMTTSIGRWSRITNGFHSYSSHRCVTVRRRIHEYHFSFYDILWMWKVGVRQACGPIRKSYDSQERNRLRL